MRTKLTPGTSRTLYTAKKSSDYCDVTIVEEDITLRFERMKDGVIRCTSIMRESSDAPDRASRPGFEQARARAIQEMNALRGQEAQRAAHEEPIVDSSSVSECVLKYANKVYSFSCDAGLPLVWDNLRMSGVMSKGHTQVHLEPAEYAKLKKRALSQIKARRREDYEDDGLGPLRKKTQLELRLDKLK